MKKTLILFIIMILMLTAASASAETKITVNGTGEVRVSADTAVISLGVNARDKDVLKAQQMVNESIAAIRTALTGQGIKEENINTEYINIHAAYDYRNGQEELSAYDASSTLAIKVTDMGSVGMLIDTLDDILGRRNDVDTAKRIKQILNEDEAVRGAYDLLLHNYGPDKFYASVHLELPDTMTVEEVDTLTRKLQNRVHKETGVILAGVGVYSYNTKNDEAAEIRNKVLQLVKAHPWALQMHGFYVDTVEHAIRFDVVLSFEIAAEEGLEILYKEIGAAFPGYDLHIAPDVDAG